MSSLLFKFLRKSETRFSSFRFFSGISFPGLLSIPLGSFSNFYENSRRFSQLCVNENCEKLLTRVNDTSDQLSPVSLLPAKNPRSPRTMQNEKNVELGQFFFFFHL